jgi:hypothetical protein
MMLTSITFCGHPLLVFADKTYGLATLRDIAECAQISIPRIYYYLRNKEELLYLISRKTTRICSAVSRNAVAPLGAQRSGYARLLTTTLNTVLPTRRGQGSHSRSGDAHGRIPRRDRGAEAGIAADCVSS